MGFFQKIKEFFSEEKLETLRINKQDLEEWYSKELNIIENKLKEAITPIKEKIEEQLVKAKENIITLENAELRNKKIPEREKSFMDGNRSAYIKSSNSFITQISISIENHIQAADSCTAFHKSLALFSKGSYRSYTILQQFFEHEARAIAANIKSIEQGIKDIEQSIKNSSIVEFKNLKIIISDMNNVEANLKRYNEDLAAAKKDLEVLKNKKQETLSKINQLKESGDYRKHLDLVDEIKKIKDDIREAEDRLLQKFSVLETALKKYVRIALDQKLILDYMEKPIAALLEDDNLAILDMFGKLKDNINKEKLDLKDKKRDKTLSTIDELSRDFLTGFKSNYKNLKSKLSKADQSMISLNIGDEELKLNTELSSIENNIKAKESDIERIENSIKKTDSEELKNTLQENLSKILNKNVVIVSS